MLLPGILLVFVFARGIWAGRAIPIARGLVRPGSELCIAPLRALSSRSANDCCRWLAYLLGALRPQATKSALVSDAGFGIPLCSVSHPPLNHGGGVSRLGHQLGKAIAMLNRGWQAPVGAQRVLTKQAERYSVVRLAVTRDLAVRLSPPSVLGISTCRARPETRLSTWNHVDSPRLVQCVVWRWGYGCVPRSHALPVVS